MDDSLNARPRAVLIFGPTAAGKSAVALRLAERFGGAILNADSMQVYREWRILTARPSEADCRAAPHRLYGTAGIRDPWSVGVWLRNLGRALDETESAGLLPIVVGGTGAYFRALTGGLADIPAVTPAARRAVEAQIRDRGLACAARELSKLDPVTAERIDLRNPRRVARALEVLRQTGAGLAEWHARTPPPLVPDARALRIVIAPAPDVLRQRIEARFDAMMKAGALQEAERVLELGAPRDLPGMRPVGAAALFAHLDGRLSESEAVDSAKSETRQYARRQRTWFRNRMRDWTRTECADPEEVSDWTLGQASKAGLGRR